MKKYKNIVLYIYGLYRKDDNMDDMNKLVSFCKQHGYIYQGSEIYGGLANTWDYGPLGSKLKNNLKDAWRRHFIHSRNAW